MDAKRTPVIVGVGELADRSTSPGDAREPIDLMRDALRIAERDAGHPLLGDIDGLEIINEISWPYPDPCGLLAARIGAERAECRYHPVGGQTPMLAIHRAALAIRSGSWRSAAICGAEAQASVTAAKRSGATLDWSPAIPDFRPVRGAAYQQPVARALDFATPAHVYPFYESATRVAWGQALAEAQTESATIWAGNARIAAGRSSAWIKRTPDAAEIATPGPCNRLIAWPYPKLMTANPGVNQAAAVLVCSLAHARALGIADDRIIHVHDGAAADEPRDYLSRRDFASAPAMDWVLDRAMEMSPGERFDAVELYSCFPVVPKMARRRLGLAADAALSVAGGMTFFGAPLNNYMTHATVAMVERLRRAPGRGLLYAQGEYLTKHHALVLGSAPAPGGLGEAWRRADDTDLAPIAADHVGPARARAATVLYDREGAARHGGVILHTPDGANLLARVPVEDDVTLAAILSDRGVVGATGRVGIGADGLPDWRLG